jgi:hypothetical protein
MAAESSNDGKSHYKQSPTLVGPQIQFLPPLGSSTTAPQILSNEEKCQPLSRHAQARESQLPPEIRKAASQIETADIPAGSEEGYLCGRYSSLQSRLMSLYPGQSDYQQHQIIGVVMMHVAEDIEDVKKFLAKIARKRKIS